MRTAHAPAPPKLGTQVGWSQKRIRLLEQECGGGGLLGAGSPDPDLLQVATMAGLSP